ncbi:MAG: Mrp/NBP35 family ATP-binding protein, partial [Shimia sp.]|nr:Mrp/NBP35 family ATP-binding protein [Shimia sp.]
GVAAEAEKLNVPLLAEIPLAMDIRVAADGGAPLVVSKPNAPQSQAFRALARSLIESGNA